MLNQLAISIRLQWATLPATAKLAFSLHSLPHYLSIHAMGHFNFSLSVYIFVPCYFSSSFHTHASNFQTCLFCKEWVYTRMREREKERKRERERERERGVSNTTHGCWHRHFQIDAFNTSLIKMLIYVIVQSFT